MRHPRSAAAPLRLSPQPRRAFTALLTTLTACGFLTLRAAESPAQLSGPAADLTTRYLAGLPPATPDPPARLAALFSEPAARAHAAAMDAAFRRFQTERLAPIQAWAPWALGPLHQTQDTLIYFFSGPDFLYAATLFPAARATVLCGLEPVGALPDPAALTPAARESGLTGLRDSLADILAFSFFKTKEMKTGLTGRAFDGTLPLLLCFLGRTGHTVTDIRLVRLDKTGRLIPPGQTPAGRAIRGVEIRYHNPAAAPGSQTLFYFTADLSDSGLAAHDGILAFCSGLSPSGAFLKSASYLLHTPAFSRVRSFLLATPAFLLQDDSGIPLRDLTSHKRALRLFGVYKGPIDLFQEFHQPDLETLFAQAAPAPLPFGIGYRHRPGTSNLLLALRGPAAAQPAPPAPLTPQAP